MNMAEPVRFQRFHDSGYHCMELIHKRRAECKRESCFQSFGGQKAQNHHSRVFLARFEAREQATAGEHTYKSALARGPWIM